MTPDRPPMLERLAASLLRHRWWVLALGGVAAALSIWASVLLPVYTSRKALLPQNTDVSRRLNRFLERFGAAGDLILVVEGPPRSEREEFASALSERLRALPQVRSAFERIDLAFFLENGYLLVPPDALEKFASVVEELIGAQSPSAFTDWNSALQRVDGWLDDPPPMDDVDVDLKTAEESLHLVSFFLEQWLRWLNDPLVPRRLDWNRLLARHGAESMANSYFASRNGGMLFVFVHATDASEEFKSLAPFIGAVRDTIGTLQREWRAAGRDAPRVSLTGLPATSFEEFVAIRHDIWFTVCSAAALIILLILAWLRSLRWALVVFLPMGLGVLVNTGLAYLIVGHLTILTAGFTAILFGLGVDYGIFLSTRIIEELRAGQALERAIFRGLQASIGAILTAGGATVLIFAALIPVPFDGFSELGTVASLGVGLVLLCTFCVQPVLFFLLPPRVRPQAAVQTAASAPVKVSRLPSVVTVSLALVVGGMGIVAALKIPFNYDVLSLLPRGSESAVYQQRMVAESDFQAEVVIFTAPDIPTARELSERAVKLPSIAQVQRITDLFPPDAGARAEHARTIGRLVAGSETVRSFLKLDDLAVSAPNLQRVRSALGKALELMADGQEQAFSAGHKELVKLIERISEQIESIDGRLERDPAYGRERTEQYARTLQAAVREALRVLTSWKDAQPMTPARLPPMLRDRFFASDGTVAFYAYPAKTVYDPENLATLVDEVYSVSPEATGFPTTHQVFSHMVVTSFKLGSLLSALAAALWLLFALRNLRGWLLAVLPLAVGGGWMMSVLWLSGESFNYANIIALPLVMGLAVDYGVWFAHRWRELSGLSVRQVARTAGRAILLAAGTTLAGLGAITLASYRGVSSLGLSITLGLLCCVVAALLVSPALAQLMTRRQP